jgi:hypothetical protein
VAEEVKLGGIGEEAGDMHGIFEKGMPYRPLRRRHAIIAKSSDEPRKRVNSNADELAK